MNVLFVCENYIPHYGGAEVVFKNLAEGYVKRGHSVCLITHQLKGTKINEKMNGVFVKRIPSFHSRYVFSFAAIPEVIRKARKADVIQTTTFNGAFPAWIAGKIQRKPVVLTVHEVWVGKWKQVTSFSWLKRTIHELLERAIYLLPFDKYVCVSEATRSDLLKLGMDEDKVSTIYNGFDYEFWNPLKFSHTKAEEIKDNHNLNQKFVCFSWGRPGESKGFEYLIKAMPLIRKKIPNAVLLLMLGSVEKHQEKYRELKELIRKHKLQKIVNIIPSAPYEELGNYIKAADCAIIPSVAEGFGYSVVEANAMGTPVVASDAGSIPEVVSGKHLLFKSKDIHDLAAKVEAVSHNRFQKIPLKTFEWSTSIGKYLQTYRKFIGRSQ
jgi:D-inositol-3-phosphate glycosyltransferase